MKEDTRGQIWRSQIGNLARALQVEPATPPPAEPATPPPAEPATPVIVSSSDEIKQNPFNVNRLITLYFSFKIIAVLISAGAICLGHKLFILGVTGQASLSIESHTVSGQLLNAAPGLFFAVGGLIALVVSIIKGVGINF